MQRVPWQDDLKQESVSLVTRARTGATPVILGSDLAQEEIMMTLTHVETTLDLADQRIKAMGYILVEWKRTAFNIHYIFVKGAKKLIGTSALSCLATSSTGLKCDKMVLFCAVY